MVEFAATDSLERILRAAQKSYHKVGRKERHEALFPELREVVRERRLALKQGLQWPTAESRRTPAYKAAMAEICKGKIGGTEQEQVEFFEQVIAAHCQTFWIDGCDAPEVKGIRIGFRLKPGARPVARQPIPLSPFDDLRVEYHLEENVALGKCAR